MNAFATFGLGAASTFVGAGLAFLSNGLARRSSARSAEYAALNVLVVDMAGRRALNAPETTIARPVDTSENSDYRRVIRSVLAIRAEVMATFKALRPNSPAWDPLIEARRACNHFLELSEVAPEEVWISINALQRALNTQVERLNKSSRGRVFYMEPGVGAL